MIFIHKYEPFYINKYLIKYSKQTSIGVILRKLFQRFLHFAASFLQFIGKTMDELATCWELPFQVDFQIFAELKKRSKMGIDKYAYVSKLRYFMLIGSRTKSTKRRAESIDGVQSNKVNIATFQALAQWFCEKLVCCLANAHPEKISIKGLFLVFQTYSALINFLKSLCDEFFDASLSMLFKFRILASVLSSYRPTSQELVASVVVGASVVVVISAALSMQ